MKKLLLAGASLAFLAVPAMADTVDDPLHSAVCGAGGTGCVNTDLGAFAPIAGDVNWTFMPSPGPQTGETFIVVLVPTNQINPLTYNTPTLSDNGGSPFSGNVVSRLNLFNAGNGASLAAYAGLPAAFGAYSPTDNFSNASAGQSTYNPGFNGNFLVFTFDLGMLTLDAQGAVNTTNNFSAAASLPVGTVITAFMESQTTQKDIGTAPSEDLIVTHSDPVPGPVVGAGLPGMMAMLFGGLLLSRRRRNRALSLMS
jgi:hypothetical protein